MNEVFNIKIKMLCMEVSWAVYSPSVTVSQCHRQWWV